MNKEELSRLAWRKSSRSNGQNNCVEVAFLDSGGVAVRDSKDTGRGSVMIFTAAEWDAFIGGAMDGEFNRPTA